MAHKDLRTHLGLPETATEKEITSAYTTRKNELEARSLSAPTETLKNAYDTALKELETLYLGLSEKLVIPTADKQNSSMFEDLSKNNPTFPQDNKIRGESLTT